MVDIEEDKLEHKSGDKSEHLAEATRVSEDKLRFNLGEHRAVATRVSAGHLTEEHKLERKSGVKC